MKSSLLILAALVMLATLASATPATAMSVDHDSSFATSNGGSRFSDPDDALGGNDQTGAMHFGSADGSSMTFGIVGGGSNSNSNSDEPPHGYAMQGCMAAVCQH